METGIDFLNLSMMSLIFYYTPIIYITAYNGFLCIYHLYIWNIWFEGFVYKNLIKCIQLFNIYLYNSR